MGRGTEAAHCVCGWKERCVLHDELLAYGQNWDTTRTKSRMTEKKHIQKIILLVSLHPLNLQESSLKRCVRSLGSQREAWHCAVTWCGCRIRPTFLIRCSTSFKFPSSVIFPHHPWMFLAGTSCSRSKFKDCQLCDHELRFRYLNYIAFGFYGITWQHNPPSELQFKLSLLRAPSAEPPSPPTTMPTHTPLQYSVDHEHCIEQQCLCFVASFKTQSRLKQIT